MLDIERHLDIAAVIDTELQLELAIHQPNCSWFHHQNHSTLKLICIEQCSSTHLDQLLPLSLGQLQNGHQRQF